jgi:hypothetical protein
MSKKTKPFARIAISLPTETLAAADRLARRLDRSRSWVVAEAIRRFAAGPGEASSSAPSSPNLLREPGQAYLVPSGPGLGPLRLIQLEADLRLSAEERVRAAEGTARLNQAAPTGGEQLRFFARSEDYLRWKQREASGGWG